MQGHIHFALRMGGGSRKEGAECEVPVASSVTGSCRSHAGSAFVSHDAPGIFHAKARFLPTTTHPSPGHAGTKSVVRQKQSARSSSIRAILRISIDA